MTKANRNKICHYNYDVGTETVDDWIGTKWNALFTIAYTTHAVPDSKHNLEHLSNYIASIHPLWFWLETCQ